jgi:anion-transporting  ArsA/GET3 family ATPase
VRSALSSRELIVVTGKGGVGKSAVAAALGTLLSEEKRVLVLEVDPRENVHQLFAAPPSGGDFVRLAPGLHLQNLRPGQVFDQLVTEKLRLQRLVDRVLASPVYQHFTGGAPGLEEMAVLGHALRVLRGLAPGGPEVDVIVLDAPATGHGVSLLAAPLLVTEVIQHGPIGHMTREVAKLIGDEGRSAVVVVTLAEEMPATEAIELRAMMAERLERRPDLLVVNALYPPVGETAAAAGPTARLWRRRRRLNEAELERLAAAWPEARAELPMLPLERGPDLVNELSEGLRAGLGWDEEGA